MPQWIVDLFGPSLAQIVWVALVAAMVCGLAVVLIGLFKRLFANGTGIGPRTRAPRLQVVDVARIDEKRKLVLVRRDEVEHLVLVGGQTDLLVEGSILRVPAAVRPHSRSDEPRLDMPAAPPPSRHPSRPETNGAVDPVIASAAAPARASGQGPRSPKTVAETGEDARRDGGPQRVEPRDMQLPVPEPRRDPAANGGGKAPNRGAEIGPIERPSDGAAAPAAARPAPQRSAAAARTDPEVRIDAELRPQSGTRPAAVAAPLKPTEPPALNPSTLAFSRATPTVAELAARPARSEALSPQPAATRAAPSSATSPSQSAGSEAGRPAARREPTATATVQPAARAGGPNGGDSQNGDSQNSAGAIPLAEPGEEMRTLSVRSFASAIQNRRYSRIDPVRQTDAGPASAPPRPAAPSRATPTPDALRAPPAPAAADPDEDLAALDRSLEDFLSSELSAELAAEARAEQAETSQAPAAPLIEERAAEPKAEPRAPAPSSPAAVSPPPVPAGSSVPAPSSQPPALPAPAATTPASPAAASSGPARPVQRPEPAVRPVAKDEPAAPQHSTTPAPATPGTTEGTATGGAAPTQTRPAVNEQPQPPRPAQQPAASAPTPAPAKPAATPAPRAAPVVTAVTAPSPAVEPAGTPSGEAPTIDAEAVRTDDPRRSRQEISLEEEMKRLLGEFDFDSPSRGQNQRP